MRNTDEAELDAVVTDRREVADQVVSLCLQHPTGDDLPPWTPGSHVDLVLPEGLVRQYSLCGDPRDRTRWRIAILREPESRGGSAYVHDQIEIGDRVRIRGPRNHFALEAARCYRFIAGGIGITPILPQVAAADAAGANWTLTYGGRTRTSMAFLDELAAYGDRVTIHPQDEFGLLDLDTLLADAVTDTLVYCCGPGPLLDAVHHHCSRWRPGSLHVERFTPRAQGEPVLSGAFEVELATTGTTVTVPPGRSILDVVEDVGIPVLSSCQEGTCGTCETTVLAGAVDHRDSVLTDEEKEANDTILICVSRAAGPRLVLDL